MFSSDPLLLLNLVLIISTPVTLLTEVCAPTHINHALQHIADRSFPVCVPPRLHPPAPPALSPTEHLLPQLGVCRPNGRARIAREWRRPPPGLLGYASEGRAQPPARSGGQQRRRQVLGHAGAAALTGQPSAAQTESLRRVGLGSRLFGGVDLTLRRVDAPILGHELQVDVVGSVAAQDARGIAVIF